MMPRRVAPSLGRTRCGALVLACALLGATGAAQANDGIGGVDLGNVRLGHTDKVAMAKEVLDIAADRVAVDYTFLNESPQDVHESLVFPLPEYSADDATGEDGYWGQPHGFRILVDGQPHAFTASVVARFQGRDITARLKALGLTDRQIALFPGPSSPFDVTEPAYTAQQRRALTQLGWMDTDANDRPMPAWRVSVTYVWFLTFPAGRPVHVHHEYRPFPTVGVATVGMTAADLKQQACATPGFLTAWRKVSQAGSDGVRATNGLFVGYVLKTGNTWKDGIRDFTLRLHRASPQGLTSACFPVPPLPQGPDPLVQTYHVDHFHPAQDLSVYFGNLPDAIMTGTGKQVAPLLSDH